MTVATLVVPLDRRGDDSGLRHAHWRWLADRYRALHPGWPCAVAGDPGDPPFAKARAVNAAAARATTDVVAVVDADVLVDRDALEAAAGLADADHRAWVVPFGDVHRLTAAATEEVVSRGDPGDVVTTRPLEARQLDPQRPPYRGKAGGGAVVLSRAALAAVGGMDERFAGWGGEDYALGHALRACLGRPARLAAPLWHLWHPPAPGYDPGGRLPPDNERLLRRYRRASSSADTMRALLDDRGGDHVGCGCNGSTPSSPPATPTAACVTCGLSFVEYDEAQAHKNGSGHVIRGLRGLRAASRRGDVVLDPFAPAL